MENQKTKTSRKLKYEAGVINPLLRCIKNNQEFLTQPENLSQLAKLGYIYNTLWYSGRVCFGYDGIIKKDTQCEDNPKYKIEMCDPINDEIENFIYDAWSMHVSNDDMSISWEDFQKIVYQTEREYTEHEKLGLKVNKIIEDWVNYLTSDDYKYTYSNRKEVVSNLLCTIGTEYDYFNGHIIMTAGGADQNISLYGEWEKAEFAPKIKKIVDRIMAWDGLSEVLDKHKALIGGLYKKKAEEELARDMKTFGMPYKEWCKSGKDKELMNSFFSLTGDNPKIEYQQYYPISDYSNISKFDENTEASYIKAGIEICEDMIAHATEERPENIKFAKTFLLKFKKDTYEQFYDKLVDGILRCENAFRKSRQKEQPLLTIEDIKEGLENIDTTILKAHYECGVTPYTTMMQLGLTNAK